MGMTLHDGNRVTMMHLIRDAYGGLLISLNMRIEFGDAFDYSAADCRGWRGEIGFQRFDVIQPFGTSSAV